jgi:uncharacterized protein (TIGR03437 family)
VRQGETVAAARALIERSAPGLFAAIEAEPSAGERVILLLFGTGIRGRTGLESIQVTVGGRPATVLAAEPHSLYPGLDQVNVEVPGGLAPGLQQIVMSVDGQLANAIEVSVR